MICATSSELRAWVWAFSLLGSVLFAAVVGIAVASLPAFHLFGSEPARLNTWVTRWPYVWLPAGLVGAALSGQLLLWRRLLSRAPAARAAQRDLRDSPAARVA